MSIRLATIESIEDKEKKKQLTIMYEEDRGVGDG